MEITAPLKPSSLTNRLLPFPRMVQGIFSSFNRFRTSLSSSSEPGLINTAAGPPMRKVVCRFIGSIKRKFPLSEVITSFSFSSSFSQNSDMGSYSSLTRLLFFAAYFDGDIPFKLACTRLYSSCAAL